MALAAQAIKLGDYHDHDGDLQDDDDNMMVKRLQIHNYDDVPDLAEANSHGIYSPDVEAIVPDMPELAALNQAKQEAAKKAQEEAKKK